jgi:hypothetical protein
LEGEGLATATELARADYTGQTIAAILAYSGSAERDIDRDSYLAASIAVFATLPVVPGSEEVAIRS